MSWKNRAQEYRVEPDVREGEPEWVFWVQITVLLFWGGAAFGLIGIGAAFWVWSWLCKDHSRSSWTAMAGGMFVAAVLGAVANWESF